MWALEPRSAALLHELDEAVVDFLLHHLEAFNVVGLFRQERIEHRLVLAGGIEPALDAELVHQLGKTEGAADHADRADDGRAVADDLVGGTGDHVTAGGGDVLREGDHRLGLFGREFADAAIDQVRLHRRAARRIDQQGHGAGLAITERPFERPRDARQRDARLERRR